MIEKILTTAIGTVPGMVIMGIMVFWFLKYLRSRDEGLREVTDAVTKAVVDTAEQIGKNNECLREVNTAIRSLTERNP